MKSVAIVGGFAAGKTTVADGLVLNHGYQKVSLATRLKEVGANALNGGESLSKTEMYQVVSLKNRVRLISGREVLQELGQALKLLDRDVWVKWLVSDIKRGMYGAGPFVVDDCRFWYEADALSDLGFVIARLAVPEEVRVERYARAYGRPPTSNEMSHPSEVEMRLIEEDVTLNGMMASIEVLDSLVEYLRDA